MRDGYANISINVHQTHDGMDVDVECRADIATVYILQAMDMALRDMFTDPDDRILLAAMLASDEPVSPPDESRRIDFTALNNRIGHRDDPHL